MEHIVRHKISISDIMLDLKSAEERWREMSTNVFSGLRPEGCKERADACKEAYEVLDRATASSANLFYD